ncbi:MAG: adenylate/guanylate cyclase domain-containing protein, partial [Dehalococcoidia bacterium]|nr:adenylate/guanylate cyclase domain-containing protein [Dehalococcoidia bacterium]
MNELPTGEVTFLLTDVEGSTRLWEAESDAMRQALGEHDDLLTAAVEAHDGAVIKSKGEGDSLFAVFSTAANAVAAAVQAQYALAEHDWGSTPLRVRMAIHTGTAQLRDGDYYGPTVNRAARLRAIGHGGQILLSSVAAGLSRASLPAGCSLVSMGQHRLKDLNEPEAVFQLTSPELLADLPPLRSLDTQRHNLPVQPTEFIGREAELAELQEKLRSHRLVTLTGSGGAGKTRLALQLASAVIADFEDGVWFTELAPTSDPEALPFAVARALGVRDQGQSLEDSIVSHLESSELLLVLDNCEHLVAAAAALSAKLLRSAPGLKIVTTSREPLHIAGELVWRIPSLTSPDLSPKITASQVSRAAAARLFIERAREAEQAFELSDGNAFAIARICRRLDGIPLALELAAARLGIFSIGELADRIDRGFDLLTRGDRTALPRQQTLRGTIDWSHELLEENERTLFRRLSVFVGGWTIHAAEAVCGDDELAAGGVPDLLANLVEKSLVAAVASEGTRRFAFLESIREYALEQLIKADDETETRERHFEWCARLASGGKASDYASEAPRLRLVPELDNARAALEWSSHEDPRERQVTMEGSPLRAGRLELMIQFGSALSVEGMQGEAASWLRRAIPVAEASGDDKSLTEAMGSYFAALTQVGHGADIGSDDGNELIDIARDKLPRTDSIGRARLLAQTAIFVQYLPHTNVLRQQAPSIGQDALAMARRLGDPSTLSYVLRADANQFWRPEQSAKRLSLLVEAARLADAGEPTSAMQAHIGLMREYVSRGEHDQAVAELTAAQHSRSEVSSDAMPVASLSLTQAMADVLTGRFSDAREALEETHRIAAQADPGNPYSVGAATCLLSLRMLEGASAENLAELRDMFQLHEIMNPSGPDVALASLLRVMLNESDRAHSDLQMMVQGNFATLDPDGDNLGALAAAAESCYRIQATDLAPSVLTAISPWNGAIPFHV